MRPYSQPSTQVGAGFKPALLPVTRHDNLVSVARSSYHQTEFLHSGNAVQEANLKPLASPPTIVVLGGINMDLIAVSPRLPQPGETAMRSSSTPLRAARTPTRRWLLQGWEPT